VVFEGLHVENGDPQQLRGIVRLGKPAELDKGHDIATVSAAHVIGFAPVDPGLEDGSRRNGRSLQPGVRSREYSRRQSPAATPATFPDQVSLRHRSVYIPALVNVSDNRIYQTPQSKREGQDVAAAKMSHTEQKDWARATAGLTFATDPLSDDGANPFPERAP
jgi:hypothetical protein